jgi:hypothetical protein
MRHEFAKIFIVVIDFLLKKHRISLGLLCSPLLSRLSPMRPALILASAVTAAAVGYIGYGFSKDEKTASEAAAPQAPAPGADVADAAPEPDRASAPAARRPAPPERPRMARVESTSPKSRHAAVTPLPRKKRVATADASLPDASALEAAAAAPVGERLATEQSAAVDGRPQDDPKDQRWIKELSGTRARVRMSKGRQDTSCRPGQLCERPEAPQDIRLAGIRVKAERLVENPSEAVEGRLRRGHYAEGTPALYVD